LEYYSQISKNMVGKVLTNRGVVAREGPEYVLLGFDEFTAQPIEQLKQGCESKLGEYVARRGDARNPSPKATLQNSRPVAHGLVPAFGITPIFCANDRPKTHPNRVAVTYIAWCV
jgi:hypothetical protein